MHFQVQKTLFTRQWYWRLVARNGRKIATSGESYHNLNDCLSGIGLVKGASEAGVGIWDSQSKSYRTGEVKPIVGEGGVENTLSQ